MFSKLQYISQGKDAKDHLKNIHEVLDAGCTWIQLRIKQKEELEKIAEKVKISCDQYQSTLIINDYVEIAKSVDASGVHLGLNDRSVNEARKILGNDKIIGGTANTLENVKQRIDEKCDYIGLGPFRFTQTKEKLSPILGLDGYKSILSVLPYNQIPIYAIGGIDFKDISKLLKIGLYGVAISQAISIANDKKMYIKNINHILYE